MTGCHRGLGRLNRNPNLTQTLKLTPYEPSSSSKVGTRQWWLALFYSHGMITVVVVGGVNFGWISDVLSNGETVLVVGWRPLHHDGRN